MVIDHAELSPAMAARRSHPLDPMVDLSAGYQQPSTDVGRGNRCRAFADLFILIRADRPCHPQSLR